MIIVNLLGCAHAQTCVRLIVIIFFATEAYRNHRNYINIAVRLNAITNFNYSPIVVLACIKLRYINYAQSAI